jgi:hypothetical protein
LKKIPNSFLITVPPQRLKLLLLLSSLGLAGLLLGTDIL